MSTEHVWLTRAAYDNLAAELSELLTEGRRRMGAVGMLEGEDQAAAGLVVAEHGARPREGGRIAQAGAAAQIVAGVAQTGIEFERQAAALAQRRRQPGCHRRGLPARARDADVAGG